MTKQKQIKKEEKFELISPNIFPNIFPGYKEIKMELKEVRDFIQNIRKQALEEGRRQTLEEIKKIIDKLEPHITTIDLEDEGKDYSLIDKEELKSQIKKEMEK